MLTAYKIYKQQIRNFKARGICKRPFKYFLQWRGSLQNGASSVSDELPWITFETINFLKKTLRPSFKIFEYGGGGSTLFFIKRVHSVVTVEHDKEWFKKLEQLIQNKNTTNWTGFFIEPGKGDLINNPDAANPEHYSSLDKASNGSNYKNYAIAIDNYADSYFDLVLVDGRSRPSCIKHTLPKIRKGGFLILDNSDRAYYLVFFKELLEKNFNCIIDDFGPSPYSKDFTKTSVWVKK